MAKQIQMQVSLEEVKTAKDGGCRLKLDTQELGSDELATLFSLKGGNFWCCLSETVVKQEDLKIPELVTSKEEKSPSERLRSRMAAYFKEKNGTFDGFNPWYSKALEDIGSKYLSKLD